MALPSLSLWYPYTGCTSVVCKKKSFARDLGITGVLQQSQLGISHHLMIGLEQSNWNLVEQFCQS